MALIVEDGTNTPGAQSYASVAVADAYHSDFGNDAWENYSETEKENALRQATRYIDTVYDFLGEKKFYNQPLKWPRCGYADYEPWPVPNLVAACCELALRAAVSDLLYDTEDQVILREVIGPLRTDFAYKNPEVRYTVVDRLLRELTTSSGSSVRIEFTG